VVPTSSVCDDLSNVVVVFWYRCECISECVLFWCFIMRKHGEEPSSCCVFSYLIFGTDRSRDDVQQNVCLLCVYLFDLVQTSREMMCSRLYVSCGVH
jgi:hypothetical protein